MCCLLLNLLILIVFLNCANKKASRIQNGISIFVNVSLSLVKSVRRTHTHTYTYLSLYRLIFAATIPMLACRVKRVPRFISAAKLVSHHHSPKKAAIDQHVSLPRRLDFNLKYKRLNGQVSRWLTQTHIN